jgi:Alpha 1,4-glycosyltransferase conserved region
MLWIGDRLSPIEIACLTSFLAASHGADLYTYGPVADVPDGVHIRDATEILPRDSVFEYRSDPGRGSPAAFANLFRYKLLSMRGGWWVDADIFCLRPFEFATDLVFGLERRGRANNCVIKAPAGHPLMEYLCVKAGEMGPEVSWGQTGPELLTSGLQQFGLLESALPAAAFCPIDHLEWRLPFRAVDCGIARKSSDTSFGLHLWNEMLRRNGVSKGGPFEKGCLFAELTASIGCAVQLEEAAESAT